MQEILKCTHKDYAALIEIWERSVRATHLFLDNDTILEIKSRLGTDYFPAVELYALHDNDVPVGFLGLSPTQIEMLFIDSTHIGKGYGSHLIDFAKKKGVRTVDVNEQNPAALQFYLRKGFKIIGRDETDDAGLPYPILHLSL